MKKSTHDLDHYAPTIDISDYDDGDDYDGDDYDDPDGQDDREDHTDRLPSGNRAQRRAADKRSRQQATKRRMADESTPLEREVEGVELVGVQFDGETYWCPADPLDWPARAIKAFEDQKALTCLQYLLQRDEDDRSGYQTLMEKDYTLRQINELFHKLGAAGGFERSGN
ncbi:hypothetical protein ACFQNE_02070 [Gordonia phosphorivorans]|uniref:Tail assembly chaperone n=1 Tax=Gordonia phosphorivorans TaxID=1056982 RepID=A0ABV6H7A5_9ACTN